MHYLSKSDYLKFRIHPAYLWYQKNKPSLLPAISENQKYIFEQGYQFEKIAQKLFTEAKEVTAEMNNLELILSQTTQILNSDWKTLFQAGFLTNDGLFCRTDIIEKTPQGLILSEVKSSTSVKNNHLFDLAFQATILQQLGFTIVSCRVLHVNKFYKRKTTIKPSSIVAIRDVSEEVMALIPQVNKEILQAQSIVEQAEVDDHPAFAGNLAEWMPIYEHIHDIDQDSVLRLTSIKPQQVKDYYFTGIEKIDQLDSQLLSSRQAWQVRVNQSDSPLINPEGIQKFLRNLKFPLYFLDYETSAHVIPLYSGVKPYQQLPFQYSLHKLESPDAELEHFEYLHTTTDNPSRPLVEKLITEIGESGTVLAWFDKFEKYCNRTLAQFSEERKDQLDAINKRMKDLRIPFANFSYVDKNFAGSTSIKNVLPAIIPDLSYKKLSIQEGGAAQRAWQQVVFEKKGNKQTVFNDLIKYCKLDTLAMVEIYKQLLEVSNLKIEAQQSRLF